MTHRHTSQSDSNSEWLHPTTSRGPWKGSLQPLGPLDQRAGHWSRPLSLLVKRKRPRQGSQSRRAGGGQRAGRVDPAGWGSGPRLARPHPPRPVAASAPSHLRPGSSVQAGIPRGPVPRPHGPSLRPLHRQAREGAFTTQGHCPAVQLSPCRGWSLPCLGRGTSPLTMAGGSQTPVASRQSDRQDFKNLGPGGRGSARCPSTWPASQGTGPHTPTSWTRGEAPAKPRVREVGRMLPGPTVLPVLCQRGGRPAAQPLTILRERSHSCPRSL